MTCEERFKKNLPVTKDCVYDLCDAKKILLTDQQTLNTMDKPQILEFNQYGVAAAGCETLLTEADKNACREKCNTCEKFDINYDYCKIDCTQEKYKNDPICKKPVDPEEECNNYYVVGKALQEIASSTQHWEVKAESTTKTNETKDGAECEKTIIEKSVKSYARYCLEKGQSAVEGSMTDAEFAALVQKAKEEGKTVVEHNPVTTTTNTSGGGALA